VFKDTKDSGALSGIHNMTTILLNFEAVIDTNQITNHLRDFP